MCERMLTQKTRREERPWPNSGCSFDMFFLPCPGPALCKWGQPGVLFVLPEALNLVLGPPFVLSSWDFSLLCPFWTPSSYSNYLTSPAQEMRGPILGNRGVEVFLATSCELG